MKTVKTPFEPIVTDINQLEIKILCCGGKSSGESILILVYDTDKQKTVFSILIDSFYGMYKYLKILQSDYNFDSINFICWTHPHSDHTKNLDLIIDEKNSLVKYKQFERRNKYDTTISFPEMLNMKNKRGRIIKIDNEIQGLLNYITAHYPRGIEKGGQKQYNFQWRVIDKNEKVQNIHLSFLTPTKGLWQRVNNDPNRKKRKKNLNITSLSCVLKIDGFCDIFLGGDLENDEILELDGKSQDAIAECDIIKLPHHGSINSEYLLNLVSSNLKYVITTLDKKGQEDKLPSEELLNRYKTKLESHNGCILKTSEGIDNKTFISVIDISINKDADTGVIYHHSVYGIDNNYKKQASL